MGFDNLILSESGKNAILKLQSRKEISLVLCDWDMPGMSGIEVVKFIRSDDKLKDIPIIMVTGESDRDRVIEAAKEGVNGYIIKPFKPADLQNKIEQVLPEEQ